MPVSCSSPTIFAFPTFVRSRNEHRKSNARIGNILCEADQRLYSEQDINHRWMLLYLISVLNSIFLTSGDFSVSGNAVGDEVPSNFSSCGDFSIVKIQLSLSRAGAGVYFVSGTRRKGKKYKVVAQRKKQVSDKKPEQ